MTDPWAVHENDSAYYGESLVSFEERISKDGNPYKAFFFTLTPLNPELQIKEYTQFPNDAAMKQVIVPSLMKLVSDGKITSPSDMEKKQFVKWVKSEYKSRTKNDLDYFRENNPDRIGTDPHGEFVIKQAVQYLDIYPSLEACQQAYDNTAQQAVLPTDQNGEKSDPALEAAKAAIPTLVDQAGTDMQALQEKFSHPPFDKFGLQDAFVKEAVAKMVATRAGTSADEQEKLLAEINSHFNGDTPYLLIDSPELVKQLDEIAF